MEERAVPRALLRAEAIIAAVRAVCDEPPVGPSSCITGEGGMPRRKRSDGGPAGLAAFAALLERTNGAHVGVGKTVSSSSGR